MGEISYRGLVEDCCLYEIKTIFDNTYLFIIIIFDYTHMKLNKLKQPTKYAHSSLQQPEH